MNHTVCLASALLLSAVLGCGESTPTLVPLTGTLTLDGQPLPFKSLMLVPADGTPGHGAGGYSDGQGNYQLRAIMPGALKDFPGCPPGKYQVVVTEPQIPLSDASFADTSTQDAASDEPAPAVMLLEMAPKKQVKGVIPAMYTSNLTSPLAVEVVEGVEVAKLELVSK
ncbi:MAG TPA: hypothetical protein DDZ51_05405 [Planctomycetaceae bacterium]|nr:hypothetical protein [Planctomycetaceae bacterium]